MKNLTKICIISAVALLGAVVTTYEYLVHNADELFSRIDSDTLLACKYLAHKVNSRHEGFENSVAGHNERDTIIGNFTGNSIDTIYIQVEQANTPDPKFGQYNIYWAVCSNPQVHRIQLHGEDFDQPKLVFEGDLDGNGTDEWGYLHTWLCSQWRTYRIFTFYQNKWWYLTDDWILLNTPEYLRASGLEVVEPGPRKGTIHVHYGTRLINGDFEIADTIIYPHFTKLDDDDLSI